MIFPTSDNNRSPVTRLVIDSGRDAERLPSCQEGKTQTMRSPATRTKPSRTAGILIGPAHNPNRRTVIGRLGAPALEPTALVDPFTALSARLGTAALLEHARGLRRRPTRRHHDRRHRHGAAADAVASRDIAGFDSPSRARSVRGE